MMRNNASSTARKIDKGTLLLWATIAAALALSLVSAYETFIGLLDFMTDSLVGMLASGILTFGIQVLLFVISWSIANHIRDGFRANASRWAIWILCAFFSGYFSYYGFLATTGGRDESIRLAKVDSTLSEVTLGIYEMLVDELETTHQEEIAGDAARTYSAWLKNSPRKIISIANSSEAGDRITAAARESSEILSRQRQDTQNRLDPLITQRAQAQASVTSVDRGLESLQARQENLRQGLDEMKAELRAAQSEYDGLRVEYEQETKTGVGPRARALEFDANSVLGRINGLTSEVEDAETELESVSANLAYEQALADERTNQIRLNRLNSEIAAFEGRLAEIDAKLQLAKEVTTFDFQSLERTLNIATAGLINKDYQQFEVLTQQCSTLKQQLTDAGLAAEVAGISCSNPDVVEGVGRLSEMQEKLEAYDADCMQEPVQPMRPSGSSIALIQPMIDKALSCVDYVSNPREREDFRKEINALNTSRGDNADPITMASVALFEDRQGNAVMSVIFALIVDFLVLLCALVGTTRGLPERVRAIDLILNLARTPRDAAPGVEKRLSIEALESNRRAMIDPIINDLLREGLAEYADESGNQIDLMKGALARLSALRRQDVTDTYAPMASRPDPRRNRPQRRGGRD